MFDIESLKKHISGLMDEERFRHSIGVMELAALLAGIYGIDEQKATVAGLVHDAAKQLPEAEQFALLEKAFAGKEPDQIVFNNKKLWHGPAGAEYVKEKFGMDDEIASAVFYHTTGKENMSMLEKIIFLADCIEVNRDKEFDWAFDTREIAKKDLAAAMLIAVDKSLKSIIDRNLIIHPGSVMLRNEILQAKAACSCGRTEKK